MRLVWFWSATLQVCLILKLQRVRNNDGSVKYHNSLDNGRVGRLGVEPENESAEYEGLQVIEPHSHDRYEFITLIAFAIFPQDIFDALHEGYKAHEQTGDFVKYGS